MAKSFQMKFYEKCVEEAINHPNGTVTFLCDDGREDMMLLTIYPGTNHDPNYAGFGGALFVFETPEGEVIKSNNVWYRGDLSRIPKSLRSKFEVWKRQ